MLVSYNKAIRRDRKLGGAILDFHESLQEGMNNEFIYTDTLKNRGLDTRTFFKHLPFIIKKEKNGKMTIKLSKYTSVIEKAKELSKFISEIDEDAAKIFQLVLKSLNNDL